MTPTSKVPVGLSRASGAPLPLQSDEHLEQSIVDILSTQRGSRVMRRDYGSDIPDLIDQPLNALTRIRLFAAAAVALARWETRIRVRRLALDAQANGRAVLRLGAVRIDRPRPVPFTVALPLAFASTASI